MAERQNTLSGRGFQTIHLEVDDDVPVMRDRLEWAEADCVLMVVPPRNRVLRSQVNLKLLARHARNASRTLALITSDPQVVDLSRETGIVTFGSVKRAERSRWLAESAAGPTDSAVSLETGGSPGGRPEVPEAVLPERPLKDVPRPRRLPLFRSPSPALELTGLHLVVRRALGATGFLVLLVLLAAMMAVVVVFTYPTGQVRLRPARQSIVTDLVMRADPQADRIDYATLDIPARLVQVELRDTGQIPPTSSDQMPTEKAQGVVTFINLSDQAVTIPMSTTVSTSSGATVRFITTLTATLLSAVNATTPTTIIAVDPGPIGNVAAGQINNIPDPFLARQVNVINEAATSGGDVAPAGVVTRADKDRLWAIVLQQFYQKGYDQLVADLGEQEFIPPESVVVLPLEGTFDPSLDGEVTDMLRLEMRAVVRGTAVAGQHANQLALAALQADVPEGYRLDPASLEFVMEEVVGVAEQAVIFRMRASGTAGAQIDADQVVSDVRGLPTEEAQSLLSQRFPLEGEPAVTVEPDWLGRLPWLPFRIEVTVVE